MPQRLSQAPHFAVCLQMLSLATVYTRCLDTLNDPALGAPAATERINRLRTTIESLAETTADVRATHQDLPMSLIDHTDHTVRSRLTQLQVVTRAAVDALTGAVEESDPTSFTSVDARQTSVDEARDLLATAPTDLVTVAEQVAADMHRYSSAYSIPEVGAHVTLTAEHHQVLRLIAAGAVAVDEDGHTWIGLNKHSVDRGVLLHLDRLGLITEEPSVSWAEETRVASTPMGRLVLAATMSRPEPREVEGKSASAPTASAPRRPGRTAGRTGR
ncbi:hypothetical protein ABZ135_28385 [Streptomyces sp. NPDC006339]|uniref:hypothetical protein n=1 Tax=Streptomyces sp. NPDC006339 TaxID=3156755 RepID=UPI0033AAF6D6